MSFFKFLLILVAVKLTLVSAIINRFAKEVNSTSQAELVSDDRGEFPRRDGRRPGDGTRDPQFG